MAPGSDRHPERRISASVGRRDIALVVETRVGTRAALVAFDARRRGRHKTCEKKSGSDECDLRFHGSVSIFWMRTIRDPMRNECASGECKTIGRWCRRY